MQKNRKHVSPVQLLTDAMVQHGVWSNCNFRAVLPFWHNMTDLSERVFAGKENKEYDFNENVCNNLTYTKLRLVQFQCCMAVKKKVLF